MKLKLAIASLALLLAVGCNSDAEIRDTQRGQAQQLTDYNRKVGVLPNGQTLYCTMISNMDSINTRTHYIYYTTGGTSISDNHEVTEGKSQVNVVQVTLSPEELEVLKKLVKDK